MGTETDVYAIDADVAIDAITKLAEAITHTKEATVKEKEAHEGLADFLQKDLKNAVGTAEAQYDLLKEAAEGVFDVIKEGAQAYLKDQQALNLLGVTLRNAGVTSEYARQAFEKQAEEMERLTGQSKETTYQLDAVLTTLGVAPDQISRFSEAAYGLSQIMGVDVVQAARLMARGNEENKDTLLRLGIVVDDAQFKQKGFGAVMEAVEAKTKGVTDAIPEQVKQINELKADWEEFTKALGKAAVEFATTGDGVNLLSQAMHFWTNLLGEGKEKEDAETERINKQIEVFGRYQIRVHDAATAKKELEVAEATGASNTEFLRSNYENLADIVDKLSKEYKDLGGTLDLVGRKQVSLPGFDLTGGIKADEDAKKKADAEKLKQEEFTQKRLAEMKRIGSEDELENDEKQRQKDLEEQAQAAEKTLVTWDHVLKAISKEKEEALKNDQENAQRDAEQNYAMVEQHAAQIKAIWADLKSFSQQIGQEFVQSQVAYVATLIENDTRYQHTVEANARTKNLIGLSEEDATKEKVKLEKEAQDAQIAAWEKSLSAFLINIAQQAAVKAVFEAALALEYIANDNYDGAAKAGIAAAAFAAVALAAGGGAAIINNNRGLTADESQQLQDQNAANDRNQRNATQASQTARAELGAQVQVFYLGITGQTDAQQGQELQRIQNKYTDLSTGSQIQVNR